MKQQNKVPDERQKEIFRKSCCTAYIFLVLCVGASLIYKVFTTESMSWEFWALIGCCLVMLISRRIYGDIEVPTDIKDRPLPTGNSREDRKARKKDYAIRSVIFASAFAVMDVLLMATGRNDVSELELAEYLFPSLNKLTTVIVTAVIAFVGMFIISYIFDYIVGEKFKVARYNKMIAELDAEEEE